MVAFGPITTPDGKFAPCFFVVIVEYIVQPNFIVLEIEASSGDITSFPSSIVIFSPPKKLSLRAS
jgi:hypothetical protein